MTAPLSLIDSAHISTPAKSLTRVSGHPSANPMAPTAVELRSHAEKLLEDAARSGVR